MNRERTDLRFTGRRKQKGRNGRRNKGRPNTVAPKKGDQKKKKKKEQEQVEVEAAAGRGRMDGVGISNKRIPTRPMWREGGLTRVGLAATVVATSGAAYASFRQLPPPLVVRATASCFLLSAPLFALREVVAAGLSVDGPVASAIVGGFAGYVGALAFTSGTWKAVSHGAMVVGVGAGLFDTMLTSIDYRRKELLLRWQHDASLERATKSSAGVADRSAPRVESNQDAINVDGVDHSHSISNRAPSAESHTLSSSSNPVSSGEWPVWLPVVKQSEDEEYLNLVQSHKATAAALEQEQARIAQLLDTIEKLKASHSNDSDTSMLSVTSEPRPPPPAAKCV